MGHTAAPMIGRAPAFLKALELIERMARYDAPVLIQGETGTGKELAARAIHYRSARSNAPFVAVNCGAIPESLVESELFGCERGAFTDARQARSGLVADAEGGTLFLDELDSLPQRAQVTLLRFLQDHTYRRVGSSCERHCEVRVIAAASARLPALLKSGAFRDDLAFRLGVLQLDMPALRDRPGDARLLAEHFIARHARQHGGLARVLHPNCLPWLQSYAWPGNVRELDNRVQRALLLSDETALHIEPPLEPGRSPVTTVTTLLPFSPAALAPSEPAAATDAGVQRFNDARDDAMRRFERGYLERLMQAAAGNVTRAARLAGKERRSLGRLLKRHGIDGSLFHTC
jgi:DNA-binding NtrC family response regulator